MKQALTLLTSFCISVTITAQTGKMHCSAVKTQKHGTLKSNTLNPQQLVKQELYDVHYYFLDLQLDNLSTNVSGTVQMHGKARSNCDSVLFELYQDYTISDLRLNGTSAIYKRQGSTITVPASLSSGQAFQVQVTYSGTAPTGATNPLGGGGLTNDTSPSWGNQVTWSLSEPFSAYEWFPCKQSLRDKIDSVDMNITVPSTCKAGSNGVLTQVSDLGNGKSRYSWKSRYPIDYYLISVSVAEYVDYSIYAHPAGADSILIQNYIYNNPATLPNFQADIDETADFITLFSNLYGLYPFHKEKYGHCMAPLSGGMEHQTMTTQGYFDPSLTAHELAHQWWGDQVTCSSWADIWINEGFASYSEYVMLENLYPGDQVQDMLDRHDFIMSQPDGSIWVRDSLDADRIFSSRLTYDKGAAFIHILRHYVNNDALFFEGLRQFQQQYKYSTAGAAEFKNVLETHTGMDLTKAFEEWFYGEGFPTYNVIWNESNDSLHVRISQTVSAVGITPYFTNPIELRVIRSVGGDTLVRFYPTAANCSFLMPDFGSVITINAIDPSNWIINGPGNITRDLNLNVAGLNPVQANDIRIFPNPATDEVNFLLPEGHNWTLRITDSRGSLVSEQAVNAQGQYNLQHSPSGLYIFEFFSSEDGLGYRKLVSRQ